VDVVREAVKEQRRRAVGRPGVDVRDVEYVGADVR
jgi:hypothetical protein